MENGKRVNGYYLVILILALIIMTIGITFAYFTLAGKEEDDSTQIWTGTLSINYVDGKEIKAYDLFPIDEPKLGDTTYVYTKNFSVTSNGTLDQTIDLYIDITKNEFVSNHLRYSLYDANGNKITTGGLPSSGKILMTSNVFLKSGETKDYTVLLWLMETKENQNNEQDCSFSGEFDIFANQIKYE